MWFDSHLRDEDKGCYQADLLSRYTNGELITHREPIERTIDVPLSSTFKFVSTQVMWPYRPVA